MTTTETATVPQGLDEHRAAFLEALFQVLQEGCGLFFVAGTLGRARDAEAGTDKDVMGGCFHGFLL